MNLIHLISSSLCFLSQQIAATNAASLRQFFVLVADANSWGSTACLARNGCRPSPAPDLARRARPRASESPHRTADGLSLDGAINYQRFSLELNFRDAQNRSFSSRVLAKIATGSSPIAGSIFLRLARNSGLSVRRNGLKHFSSPMVDGIVNLPSARVLRVHS